MDNTLVFMFYITASCIICVQQIYQKTFTIDYVNIYLFSIFFSVDFDW